MNNIFYHSSLFFYAANTPSRKPGQHFYSIRVSLRPSLREKACLSPVPSPLMRVDQHAPRMPIAAEVQILGLTVFSFFIIAKVPMNDKSGKTGNHAELLSACSYRQYIIIP
jgi:hypothetical protein